MDMSIIIPAYNESDYINTCLDCIIKEIKRCRGRYDVELIVVNNASTDDTEILAAARPEARVVNEPRKGITKARQQGLQAASGTIVGYVDADTKMPCGWITRVLHEFEMESDLVCISGPYRYYDASLVARALVWLYWRLLAVPAYWLFGYMAVGGNFATRQDALENIGGFDTRIAFYGEDTNIARRLSRVGSVKFSLSLIMLTSARRLKAKGVLRMALTYCVNFISEALLHKPSTIRYEDIR